MKKRRRLAQGATCLTPREPPGSGKVAGKSSPKVAAVIIHSLDSSAATFLTYVAEPLHGVLAARPSLSGELDDMWAKASAAWPQVELESLSYFAYVGQRLPPDGNADILTKLFAADLLLACCCYGGDSRAISLCEEANAADINRGFDSLGAAQSLRDEAMQAMRERLFVGTAEQPPAIGGFSGRGSLRKWLRVAATRTALNIIRKHKREVGIENAPDLPDAADDLELGHLKRTYQAAFKVAFAEALGDLTVKQRGLLRMHILDKLTIDDIGKLESVHRTSAARWLREAREALASGTRRRLRNQLDIGSDELDSVMRLIRSRLDVSLTRHLRRPEENTG